MTYTPAAQAGPQKLHLLVDFDGTIASIDTVDALLLLHAEPKWLDIEAAWVAGQIGSRDAMAAQVALLRAKPADLEAFVQSIEIDPGFAAFAQFCSAAKIPVTVVSDGIDHVVSAVLAKHGFTFPVRANHLEQVGPDRWRLSFPHAAEGCQSGHCKCRAPTKSGEFRVLIGDGRSDFCAAGTVELCLAKSKLIQHCADEGIPHVPFQDFHDVTQILRDLVSGAKTPTALARHKDTTHA
jgi:2-hydroxy-3-keto-5-methylthiopentenyl-1-phosphate phosphatase